MNSFKLNWMTRVDKLKWYELSCCKIKSQIDGMASWWFEQSSINWHEGAFKCKQQQQQQQVSRLVFVVGVGVAVWRNKLQYFDQGFVYCQQTNPISWVRLFKTLTLARVANLLWQVRLDANFVAWQYHTNKLSSILRCVSIKYVCVYWH